MCGHSERVHCHLNNQQSSKQGYYKLMCFHQVSTQNQTHNMRNFPSSPSSEPLLEDGNSTPTDVKNPSKLSLIPLIFLIYFEVAGGPYGQEPTVGSAGPLFAILGFLIFPFIWSIPEALITAELSTAFPGNGGFIIWAHKAFGPFWGSMMGFWKLISGIVNLASYTVLCVDYLKLTFPAFSSGLPRHLAIVFSTLMLSFLNYTGLKIVGYASVSLGVASLLPFVAMFVMAIPKIDPSRWLSLGQKGVKKDWTSFFNTLFWNLNTWDNASILAGEIEQPQKTYPKAIFSAVLLTCLAYLIPLLASTGSIPLNQTVWVDGYYARVAEMIGGTWLKLCIQIGSVLSAIGLFEAQLSCCAYQVAAMADFGFLPRVVGVRSELFDTPWIGILISTLVALPVSYMSFSDIISSVNFLYSLGMIVEFSSFIWLRKKSGALNRPFKVPLEIAGLVGMCSVPFAFLLYVIAMASNTVYLISTSLTLFGIACYFAVRSLKQRMPLQFSML